MRTRHAVQFQIISNGKDCAGILIEQLRYAGLLVVVSEKEVEKPVVEEGENLTAYILRINCPHGLNDRVWAEHNRARMASFGISAAQVNEGGAQ